MGETMGFPMIGGYLEYEDPELTSAVIEAVKADRSVPVKFFLQKIKARQEQFKLLQKLYRPDVLYKDWGLKCPGIFLFSKNLENAAQQAGESVKWFYSYRPEEEAREAIDAHARAVFNEDMYTQFMKTVDVFQARIYKAMYKLEDIIVFNKADVENNPEEAQFDLEDFLAIGTRSPAREDAIQEQIADGTDSWDREEDNALDG